MNIQELAVGTILLVFVLGVSGALMDDSSQEAQINDFSNSTEKSSERYVKAWGEGRDSWVKESSVDPEEVDSHIVEVTKYPNASPTQEQVQNAWELYNQSYEAAERKGWFDILEGLRDGYYNWKIDEIHYPQNRYVMDNDTLNPEKPEFLIYQRKKGSVKMQLAGMMYLEESVEEHGPQFGGPISVWHYHPIDQCYADKVFLTSIKKEENCIYGEMSEKSPEMVHVWFIDHPKGQFATNMSVAKSYIDGKPEKMSKKEFTEEIKQRYK